MILEIWAWQDKACSIITNDAAIVGSWCRHKVKPRGLLCADPDDHRHMPGQLICPIVRTRITTYIYLFRGNNSPLIQLICLFIGISCQFIITPTFLLRIGFVMPNLIQVLYRQGIVQSVTDLTWVKISFEQSMDNQWTDLMKVLYTCSNFVTAIPLGSTFTSSWISEPRPSS